MRTVGFYTTWSGRAPALDFVNALAQKQRNKIFWVLSIVERERIVPAKYPQKLTDTEELWEVRVDFGGQTFRLLGFFDESVLLVLASGFVKKTERTPEAEIQVATARRRDYFRRKAQP